MNSVSRPTTLAAAVVASLAVQLLPTIAAAEDTGEAIREAAQELRRLNDAEQNKVKDVNAYGISQSISLTDLTSDRALAYGSQSRLTPSTGTSYSVPAETYQPIPETSRSFGFAIKF